MMNESELYAYFDEHQLSDEAREYISIVRNSDPSRMVGTHARSNVCTFYPSHKMGFTIQAESRTGEYGYVLELEYDDDVIEYWDQPAPVSVVRTYKNGNKRKGSYTPDFLVLRKQGPVILEVKMEKKIKELIEANPADWKEQ